MPGHTPDKDSIEEFHLAVQWDMHRQLGEETRGQLLQLLTDCRSSRPTAAQMSDADQTRFEAALLRQCELIAAGADVLEMARCLMLVAVEASGRRVRVGSKDEI